MLVYCGQTVRRIKMKLGTQVGVSPGQYCVRWGFSSPRNRAQQPHFRNLRAQALAWQVLRTRSVWGSLAVGGGMPIWSVSQVQRLIRTKILKVYSFRDITCKYDIQELLKFTNCSSFQYLPHISLQYGELWPTNGWDLLASLGHPCKFQRLSCPFQSYCTAYILGVSQTLRRWTEGVTYIRQGDHHVGHWPTF